MNHYVTSSAVLLQRYELNTIPLRFAEGIGDIGKARPAKLVTLIRVWLDLTRMFILRRPDLAYFTLSPRGWAFLRDVSIVALLKLFRIRLLFHIHGRGMQARDRPALWQPLYRWAFAGTTVIHLSEAFYEEVADLVPRERFHVVPNGVPDTRSMKSEVERADQSEGCRILYLSNMIPEKGPLDLLKALSRLQEAGIRVSCSFVGPFVSESFRLAFESEVKQTGLEQLVTTHGPLYGTDRDRALARADILAFPSYYGPEAFPLVVLEAMSYGIPVVAARVGAIEDMVEDGITGFVVPPKDPVELAAKLRLLLQDHGTRRVMGIEGRRKFEENFTLSVFCERLTDVLEATLASQKGKRV